MTIRVCGVEVRDGAVVPITSRDAIVVEGRALAAVRIGGEALRRWQGRFAPDGALRHRLEQRTGAVDLTIDLRDPVRRWTVRVDIAPVKLEPEAMRALREALGELAASFEDAGIFADVEADVGRAAGALPGVRTERVRDEDAGMRGLFRALERHLPPLLAHPLRVQRLEAGPTPVSRARPSPTTLVARKLRGDRALVLGARPVEGGSPVDYGWLDALVGGLQAYTGRQLRNRQRIDFDGADDRAAWWREAHRATVAWRAHPELRGRQPAAAPTWVVSRDVNGSALMRAAAESGMSERVVGRGVSGETVRRLVRLNVADDAHLYELWTVLSVVEVLRQNFGFRFADGEPQRFRDYVREAGRAYRLDAMRLVRRCAAPDGAPAALLATVAHQPELAPLDGGGPLTPDLVLTVEPLDGAHGPRTTHVLDAKFSTQPPELQAREVALGKYLRRLDVTASFVAMPGPGAALPMLMERLDRLYGRKYPDSMVVPGRPAYGLAWGSLHAAPLTGQLGVRQFVTIALQYHRTELRHVCGQCGHVLALGDLRLEHGGAARRVLAAHADETLPGDDMVSPDLLHYRCPRCAYAWSRHRCLYGHVLMKHGHLTPHLQIDGDHNVACSACGHRRR